MSLFSSVNVILAMSALQNKATTPALLYSGYVLQHV